MYPVFSQDTDYFDDLIEEDPNQQKQYEKYTERLWNLANNMTPFVCEDRCKSPNGFFLGAPWIKTGQVIARLGEKVELLCQIWNGVIAEPSSSPSANVSIALNEKVIFKKENNDKLLPFTKSTPGEDIIEVKERISSEAGYFSEFLITIKSFRAAMEGNISCDNGIESNNNVAELLLQVDGQWAEWKEWSTQG